MSSVKDNVETRRLELEMSADELDLIERAAAVAGSSVNDFAISWLRDAAIEVIESRHETELTVEDTIAVLEAMENPPPPNDELRRLFREYKEFVNERTT